MTSINWNLLQPANVGASVMEGFKQGRALRKEAQTEKLMGALGANPDDTGALNALLRVNPEAAYRVRDFQHKEAAHTRDQNFRNALADYGPGMAAPGNGLPAASLPATASGSAMPHNGSAPSSVKGAQAPRPSDARDAAFLRMWQADPIKAMEIDSKMRDNALQRIKVMRDAYGFAIENLANVGGEADYQGLKAQFENMVAPLGIALDGIPDTYPGPEGMRSLLMRALDARKQLEALDRRDKLEWDMQDDALDNARQDRNTDSMIVDRDARRGLVVRGQNITDARGRRGQDIASSDRRRGQDMNDRRLRETGGSKGRASASSVVSVRSVDEARALPKGTVFRTPDGQLKVR